MPGETVFLAQAAPPATGQAAADEANLPPEQIDSLVAPIALYPDPLLRQVLVASTYPPEIIKLQQWLGKNKCLKHRALGDAVTKQPWDPSVQSMVALSDVVEQANPQVVYVPSNNPVVVYGPPVYGYPPIHYPPSTGSVVAVGIISFGVGIEICRGCVEAQHECALERHEGSSVNQNAQHVIATSGRQDGLAWQNPDGTRGGPIGENVARAIAQGYSDKAFHTSSRRSRARVRRRRSARWTSS